MFSFVRIFLFSLYILIRSMQENQRYISRYRAVIERRRIRSERKGKECESNDSALVAEEI